MTFSNKNYNIQNREAGVTLMLAVLVLSAITAVAFSLATIVFIEIRSAGDSFRTEPALYATFGVTEEALFQYKRYADPLDGSQMNVATCFPSQHDICKINGVTLTLPGTQPLAYDDSPRVEFLGAGVTKTIPMYLANDYNRQYDSVRIDVLPNEVQSPVKVSFLATGVSDTSPTNIPGATVSPGTPYTYSGFTSHPTSQYDLVLENPTSNQDVSVSITTVRVGNAQPDGLPFVGEQVLRIVADYVGLTRTYQIRIPIP